MDTVQSNGKVKLYSYARFSSDKQKDGTSIERQLGLAEEFVTLHPHLNLQLINRYQDEAISAKKGRNITVGMLGEFLRDVKKGEVEKGSWLGIEDFNRLSRQNYLDAKEVFEEIMRLGITIVTFRDRKTFDWEALRKNPFDFMMALMQMVAANEYIERMRTHSNRTWKIKLEAAVATKSIMSANVPHWIDAIVDEYSPLGKATKQHFELNEEKSAVVRQIVSMFLNEGAGCQSIARSLNLSNTPCIGRNRQGKHWGQANVRAILNNEGLCGRYVHNKRAGKALPTNEVITIEGYYPPLVTTTTYKEIKLLLKSANRSKSRRLNAHPKPANALQGLCFCSVCNSLMTRVSQRAYRGRKAYEKLVCIGAKSGKHKYRTIEVHTVIGHLNMLLTFPTAFSFNNDNALIRLQDQKSVLEKKIERLVNSMALMGGSDAIRKALAGLETEKADLERKIDDEASKASFANAKRMSERLIETREALKGSSTDALALNALFRRLFKSLRIDIEASEISCEWLDGRVSVLCV
jgi:hypothetical protein